MHINYTLNDQNIINITSDINGVVIGKLSLLNFDIINYTYIGNRVILNFILFYNYNFAV